MANTNVSASTQVISNVPIRQESQRANITIDIIIPAFNEEDCIEGILNDVIAAQQHDWFQIQNICVISDASTDGTDDIVRRVATTEKRVNLVRKTERKGKQDSINLALSIMKADIVVFLDADVRLADEETIAKLIKYFREGAVALVQGGLVRHCEGFIPSPTKQAAYFDWLLVDKVRRRKSISWWSIDGRVMALSRNFYQHLVLPTFLADDQFIFYSCIQQGYQFVWAADAIFYYGPPKSIIDFSHQWSRYFYYTNKSRQYFGEDLIDRDMSTPDLWKTVLSTFILHPLCGLMWCVGYTISKVEFMLQFDFEKYRRGLFWTKSEPLEIHGQVIKQPKIPFSKPFSSNK
jgi:glycosyltransferase involved in cell wall biosynthesis